MRWPWTATTGIIIGALAFHVLNEPISGVTILGLAALGISIYKMRTA